MLTSKQKSTLRTSAVPARLGLLRQARPLVPYLRTQFGETSDILAALVAHLPDEAQMLRGLPAVAAFNLVVDALTAPEPETAPAAAPTVDRAPTLREQLERLAPRAWLAAWPTVDLQGYLATVTAPVAREIRSLLPSSAFYARGSEAADHLETAIGRLLGSLVLDDVRGVQTGPFVADREPTYDATSADALLCPSTRDYPGCGTSGRLSARETQLQHGLCGRPRCGSEWCRPTGGRSPSALDEVPR